MPTLIIHQAGQDTSLSFDAPQPLTVLLRQADISLPHPCGGRGVCGKCAVLLSGAVSAPSEAEQRFGVRLSCQAVVQGDAEVSLPTALPLMHIEGGKAANLSPVAPMPGRIGAAVDIGTTTIALQLYDLHTGQCVTTASMGNPQSRIAADVIGRIHAALQGQAALLQQMIETAVKALVVNACAQADVAFDQVDALVVTGNTTMLYLLTGLDPSSLSRAPFAADCLFGHETTLFGLRTYFPHCLHAFIGADTTCALLACGGIQTDRTILLCDVGTNGELALWRRGKLFMTSTAAGPAFEGAGISCGCASVPGAIDQVSIVGSQLHCHTIGNSKAVGICGSGLLDAIAAMLDVGILDETGYLEEETYPLRDGVTLNRKDVRAVQLAKAAIYAGIQCLLSAAGCSMDEVDTLYLAGGFGSHLNIHSAVRIGMLPAQLAGKVQVIGNAALDGAAMLLMNTAAQPALLAMQEAAYHVSLDGNAEFASLYIDAMMFDAE